MGIKWTLKNPELWAEDSSCVLILNHQSSLDILGLFQFWHVPDKMTVVAKKMLMYVGPFGLASWLCKLLFIDRSQTDRARQVMNDQMGELVKERTKLLIFPEGTRRNTNQIHSFKKGAFYLAVQNQIPIQPIVFSSYQHFLNDKTKNFDSGEIIATVMPRISTKGLTEADIPALIEKSKRLMEEVYVESTLEAKAKYSKTPIGLTDKLEQLKQRLEGKSNNNNDSTTASYNQNASSNKEGEEGEESRRDFVTKEGILNRQKPALEKTINWGEGGGYLISNERYLIGGYWDGDRGRGCVIKLN